MITIPKISIPKVVFIDMDNTINFYTSHFIKMMRENPNVQYPQSIPGFYLNIRPVEEGIEAMNILKEAGYDVCIATRPSYPNLHCYTEKAEWVKLHLGEEWISKLYLTPNKARLIGDFLVDDYDWPNFVGEMILYQNDWNEVLQKIKNYEV
jgi:5'(3')-deoxyribonucleotidase